MATTSRKRPSQFDIPDSRKLQPPNLSPKLKLIHEIISTTPSALVENTLTDTGIRVTPTEVEQILKLSYSFPGPSVKFFRWAGHQLNDNHSPYAWNLVVDLLGKNGLFDAMWDAIKSMKVEGLLSLSTFASVFSSYCNKGRVDEAVMSFDVMDQYGVKRDVVGLNFLLSAVCREGRCVEGKEFLGVVMGKGAAGIRPDRDTFAILLEGWENERNVGEAEMTFGEMITCLGWDSVNVPAYDAFLSTLLLKRGRNDRDKDRDRDRDKDKDGERDGIYEAMKWFELMKEKRCYPGLKFFKKALERIVKVKDSKVACSLWDSMVRHNMCRPDLAMYNSIIELQCEVRRSDVAQELFDEMVFNGAFPDSHTYNMLLEVMLKLKKIHEVSTLINEMIKNEIVPDYSNSELAITIYLESLGDPAMAIKIWKCLLASESSKDELETVGNKLVNGLRNLDMLPEARKYAEDMIDRRIKLTSSTMSKLKQDLSKSSKLYAYDDLLKKWKSKSSSR